MFSQNNEEQIIANYFGDFKGTLLDAGANDGATFSNSRALLLNGWGGYLFEPSSVYKVLQELYKDNYGVVVYREGLGGHSRREELYESGAHVPNGKDKALVSTTIESETKRWHGVEFNILGINVIGFAEWWVNHGSPTLDFITIDIEGMDWELLQAIDLKQVGCKCLCIEWNSKPDMALLFTRYCAQFGLKEIHRNAENIIFAL